MMHSFLLFSVQCVSICSCNWSSDKSCKCFVLCVPFSGGSCKIGITESQTSSVVIRKQTVQNPTRWCRDSTHQVTSRFLHRAVFTDNSVRFYCLFTFLIWEKKTTTVKASATLLVLGLFIYLTLTLLRLFK